MKYCNRLVPNISADTIVRDLKELYDEICPHINTMLDQQVQSGGKIHLTIDAWTVSNKIPYLGITAHWMDPE